MMDRPLLIGLLAVLVWARSSIHMAYAEEPPVCDRDEDCKHSGTCELAVENGKAVNYCLCPDRYSGLHCEDFCSLDCQNGGICEFKVLTDNADVIFRETEDDISQSPIFCLCEGKFEGTHCETPYVVCPDDTQCLNGGECRLLSGGVGYSCQCPKGYAGDACSIPPNEESVFVTLGDDSDMNTFLIILVCIGVVGFLLAGVVWLRIRRTQYRYEMRQAALDNTTELGERPWVNLRNANQSGTIWFDVEPQEESVNSIKPSVAEASLT